MRKNGGVMERVKRSDRRITGEEEKKQILVSLKLESEGVKYLFDK